MYITIQGERVVAHKFRKMGEAAWRAQPAMAKIALYLMEVERRIFESQGRRGGGSWKEDTQAWSARKLKAGMDPRINIARGHLMKSMSEPEAPHQILHVGYRQVILGSDLPYADVSNRNRPFTRLLPRDRAIMRQIVADYLVEKFNKASVV
jgi:phage gpG-like protein